MNIGLSTCGKDLTEVLFREYHAAQIGYMEISVRQELCDKIDYDALKAWAAAYQICLWSFHLPFEPFDRIDISRPELAEATLAYYETLIQKAAAIGIRLFIVHPSGEPIEEVHRPARISCAQKSLAALADVAAKYGAAIAVENLPRTCLGRDSGDILALISADPRLVVCFDTNHLLEEAPQNFIRKVGHRIATTHVSDYDFLNERHWLPGEGQLDWNTLLAALKLAGYEGPWLYELGFRAPASILRPRNLTCEDFAENARALFSGSPLAVPGTPVEGLTSWK